MATSKKTTQPKKTPAKKAAAKKAPAKKAATKKAAPKKNATPTTAKKPGRPPKNKTAPVVEAVVEILDLEDFQPVVETVVETVAQAVEPEKKRFLAKIMAFIKS